MFTSAETEACRRLIVWAFEEDLDGDLTKDHTSREFVPIEATCTGVFRARRAGVLAGLPSLRMTFHALDPNITVTEQVSDGVTLQPGHPIATIHGPARAILAGERTALNILQYLSGIATNTRRYVDAVAGLPCKILDTRKTLPGYRLLAKYAARMGGGVNHRMGLYDGVLLKDNHWQTLSGASSLAHMVRRLREDPAIRSIGIEVDRLEQLDTVLPAQPDYVLLDNMTNEQMRQAVARRDAVAKDVELEASGGITLERVRAIAETGVDRISIGALTHSVQALDIGLDFE